MTDDDNTPGDNLPDEAGEKSTTPLTGMIGQAWFDEFAEVLSWEELVKWLGEAG